MRHWIPALREGCVTHLPGARRAGEELGDYWNNNRYQAFRGFAVNGFPNFFLIFGPYSVASATYFGVVGGVQAIHWSSWAWKCRIRDS